MRLAQAVLILMLSAVMLAGCSTTPPPVETNREKRALMSFDLNKCQEIQPSLFKCPELDKPLCNPDFSPMDASCLHIGKHGEWFGQDAM